MHVLDDGTDWRADVALDGEGNLVLNNRHRTLVADAASKAHDR